MRVSATDSPVRPVVHRNEVVGNPNQREELSVSSSGRTLPVARRSTNYHVLGRPAEPDLQRLVELAAAVCDVPTAVINIIDDRQQHQIAAVGLEASCLLPRRLDVRAGTTTPPARRGARCAARRPLRGEPLRHRGRRVSWAVLRVEPAGDIRARISSSAPSASSTTVPRSAVGGRQPSARASPKQVVDVLEFCRLHP